jgi:hypothetical protein
MHPLKAAAVEGVEDVLLEGLELELEPHAAASRATALSTATLPSLPLTVTSCAGGSQRAARKDRRLSSAAPAGQGKEVRKPPGFSEG